MDRETEALVKRAHTIVKQAGTVWDNIPTIAAPIKRIGFNERSNLARNVARMPSGHADQRQYSSTGIKPMWDYATAYPRAIFAPITAAFRDTTGFGNSPALAQHRMSGLRDVIGAAGTYGSSLLGGSGGVSPSEGWKVLHNALPARKVGWNPLTGWSWNQKSNWYRNMNKYQANAFADLGQGTNPSVVGKWWNNRYKGPNTDAPNDTGLFGSTAAGDINVRRSAEALPPDAN